MDSVPNERRPERVPGEPAEQYADRILAEHPEAFDAVARIQSAALHTVFDPLDPSIVRLLLKDPTAYARVQSLALDVFFSVGPQRTVFIDELTPIIIEILHEWDARGLLPKDDSGASSAPSPKKQRQACAAHARRLAAEKREAER